MSIYITTSNQISFEMHSALEQFNDDRNILKMTTGSADLDSLIDGIQEGDFYLFYGSNHVVLDAMAYGFLVNCVLSTKQKHGFESMGLCLDNADYHDAPGKTALSPGKISNSSRNRRIKWKLPIS
jgi:replicative DNA helicase